MCELNKNVDAPTCEVIDEHQIVDLPTLQLKL